MSIASLLKRGGALVVHRQSFVFLGGLMFGAVIVFLLNLYSHSDNLIARVDPLFQTMGATRHQAAVVRKMQSSPKVGRMAPVLAKFSKNNDSASDNSRQDNSHSLDQIRILCMVLTQPQNNATKAKAVKDTWGRRCTKLLFVSSVEDKELGSIAPPHAQEGRIWIWAKTKGALEYIWKNYAGDFDWLLKADDDTYVIMEGVRHLLANYEATEAMYIGHNLRDDPNNREGYMYGGAGYILSRRTLERFIKEAAPNDTICEPAVTKVRPNYRGDEDVELGRCLHNIGGVKAFYPKDNLGRPRFLTNNPDFHSNNENFMERPSESEGPECCRDTALTFHYVEPKDQYFIEYLLYHVKRQLTSRISA